MDMLDYARHRVEEALKPARKVTLATSGPAGIQASQVPCQAVGLRIYLLVPQTSDQLFNLEHASSVILLADGWEMKGQASLVTQDRRGLELALLSEPEATWSALVRVIPSQVQIHRPGGWGNLETIDLPEGYD